MKLWIARDKYGGLNIYAEKPTKGREYFYSFGDAIALDYDMFPEVTFENSPKQIKMELL